MAHAQALYHCRVDFRFRGRAYNAAEPFPAPDAGDVPQHKIDDMLRAQRIALGPPSERLLERAQRQLDAMTRPDAPPDEPSSLRAGEAAPDVKAKIAAAKAEREAERKAKEEARVSSVKGKGRAKRQRRLPGGHVRNAPAGPSEDEPLTDAERKALEADEEATSAKLDELRKLAAEKEKEAAANAL